MFIAILTYKKPLEQVDCRLQAHREMDRQKRLEIEAFKIAVNFSNTRSSATIIYPEPDENGIVFIHTDPYYLMEQLTSLDPKGMLKALENTSSQKEKKTKIMFTLSGLGVYE